MNGNGNVQLQKFIGYFLLSKDRNLKKISHLQVDKSLNRLYTLLKHIFMGEKFQDFDADFP